MEKVNILGTEYTIEILKREEDKELSDRDGYCQYVGNRIVVVDLTSIDDWKDEPEEIIDSQRKLILRHEIIHAYLNESGLRYCSCNVVSWATNEEMVDWLAMQFPKIAKTCEELNILFKEE